MDVTNRESSVAPVGIIGIIAPFRCANAGGRLVFAEDILWGRSLQRQASIVSSITLAVANASSRIVATRVYTPYPRQQCIEPSATPSFYKMTGSMPMARALFTMVS